MLSSLQFMYKIERLIGNHRYSNSDKKKNLIIN
jgi:hypothetical protein